jgi:hypothetical protein
MATHLWVFPWLAMLCGIAALLVGLLRARPPLKPVRPGGTFVGRLVVWLIGIGVLFWTALQIGDKAGVDVIPARGILLGALAGAVIAIACGGKPPESPWARPLATIGAATAFLAIGLLWLTHGEVSGLTAVAASAVLTVLCLRVSTGDDDGAATAGALYLASVAAAIQLGYSRTEEVSDAYWPYLPLMLSGAICVGLLIASALRRRVPAAIALIVVLAAGAWALNKLLVHDITVVKVIAVGLVGFAIIGGASLGKSGARSAMAPLLVGLVALVLAYTYWAGYGIALMALAGWSVTVALASGSSKDRGPADGLVASPALAVLAFALLVMLQRLISLQGPDSVSAVDPTDTWSLLALGFGAFLPQLAARWLAAPSEGATPSIPFLLGVILLIGAPPLVAFLFATHAAAEVVLGAGIGVLAIAAGPDPPPIRRSLFVSAAFAGLFLLLLLPISASWEEPTRRLRLEVLAGLAIAAVVVRLADRRPAEAEGS